MICLLCCNAYSQQFPNIQFNYLTEREGLSSNNVSCIAQDEEGFIWIGTGDGLNRLDGYRVKRFYHNPVNENSLINNGVHQIVADGNDRLWVTTREGITVYDKKNGTFKNFRHNPADPASLDDDQYANIYIEKPNSTWLTTSSSVYYFDSSLHYNKIFTGIKSLENLEKRKIEAYQNLTRDRQGNLWGIKQGFVFLVNKKTMTVAKVFGPFAGNIEAIYQDSNLQMWLGSFGGGLMSFDPKSGKACNIKLESSSQVIHSITEWRDRHHNRWLVLGTDNGIILVDPISLTTKEYTFHLSYFPGHTSLNNVVQCVFVDRQNILWIATEGGLCFVRPSHQLFDLWNIFGDDAPHSTASDWIYSLCDLSSGYWMTRWIGPGLFHFDKEGVLTETVNNVQTDHGNLPLADSLKPFYISNEGDSILWFTTNEFLVHYNLGSKKAVLYKPTEGTSNTGLRTITIVNDHTWWIRTRNNGPNGIYVFNPIARKFLKHFVNSPQCSNCVPADLLSIYLTSKKELYVTAVGEGLLKYDPQADRFITLFRFQGKDLEEHSNSFQAITEDKSGLLWIATYTGVITYDPVTKKMVRDYTGNELIGGVDITGIIFDEQQNAWLDTERGIFYILHKSGQVRQLTITAGLKNNSNGTFRMGKDHSLCSCVQGYVIHIHPSELLNYPDQKIPVHFSEATIMDSPYFFRFTSSGEKEMIATPGQKRLTVDFSVTNYDGDNRYYYKLDGAMDNWQQNENGHLAFYNLSPGKYTLRVKGGNQYSELLSNEDDVAIVVQPYWWQTNWFKLSCLALLIALATFLTRRRIVRIRHEASFKQKIAETEMMALRSQMNPHFIFNSLNSIENFMMQNEKRLASSYLNKFARLIRMILDSSRNELVPLARDMEALRLYVDLEQLRFNDKFCFKLHVDPVLLNGDYKVPALLIQPYVENAIIHGLAHIERDDLSLTVCAIMEQEYIHYSIEDNGIGRQLSSKYNKQNRPRHKSVGLAITEERINIFNRKQNANGRVTITDLFDKNGESSGTKVDILIKAV
ncbi:MAG TPA: histidine kinase [Chitinophagaceae bacterium]|jgi:ligand-binding sensor domain-containing protein|nr:histidine kinase [Chitinophagaceae bacterium]